MARSAKTLAVFLAVAGTTHFIVPAPYDSMVPRRLPGRARTYTYASGVAELLVAATLATPRTRRAGGLAAAALFVAVFPANVHTAIRWRHRPLPLRLAALARLPLQIPLITWALRASRNRPPAPSARASNPMSSRGCQVRGCG